MPHLGINFTIETEKTQTLEKSYENLTHHFSVSNPTDSAQSDNQNDVIFWAVLDQPNIKHFHKP